MSFLSTCRYFLLISALVISIEAKADVVIGYCPGNIATITPADGTPLSGVVEFKLTHTYSSGCINQLPRCTSQMKGGSANQTYNPNPDGKFNTSLMPTGRYQFSVSCTYAGNTVAKSQTHDVVRIPPAVTIANLYDGQLVSGTISVVAATIEGATMNRVVYEATGYTTTSYTAPYALNTSGLPNGPLKVTAIARDGSGTEGSLVLNLSITGGIAPTLTPTATNTPTATRTATIAPPVSNTPIVVKTPLPVPPGDQPPTVRFTQLTNGMKLTGYTSIEISGADDIGIVRIQLDLNGSYLQTMTAAPGSTNFTTTYGFNTNNYQNGYHTFKATIVDVNLNLGYATLGVYVDNPGIGQATYTPSPTYTVSPTFSATSVPRIPPNIPTNVTLQPNPVAPGVNTPIIPNSNERVLRVKVLARKSKVGRKVNVGKAVVTYVSTKGKTKVKVDATTTAQKAFPKDALVAVSVKAPGGEVRTTKAYKLTQNREIKVKLVPKS